MSEFLCNPSEYTACRPQYPLSLLNFLNEITPGKELIVDCGTGSGQAAQDLSRYFTQVIATDISHELLSKAPVSSNIIYVQAKAEDLPVKPQTVDLICIAQALHWFPLQEFYVEVNRILKPDGIIAAWCYNQCIIDFEVDNVIKKIYSKITDSENISQQRQYVYDHYQTIPFPFTRLPSPAFEMQTEWNLKQLLGYIATWPGLLDYQKKFNADVLSDHEKDFISAWGNAGPKKVRWPIHLLVGQRGP